MPKVIAQQVELDLTLDQVLTVVHQLRPEDQKIIRRAIEPPPWNQRLEELLSRVWARVESYPITEEEIEPKSSLSEQPHLCPGRSLIPNRMWGGTKAWKPY